MTTLLNDKLKGTLMNNPDDNRAFGAKALLSILEQVTEGTDNIALGNAAYKTSIQIGQYHISIFDGIHLPSSPDKVWIQHDDGEGMEVSIEKFEEFMKEFFKENI
jgi:hypothetical protein